MEEKTRLAVESHRFLQTRQFSACGLSRLLYDFTRLSPLWPSVWNASVRCQEFFLPGISIKNQRISCRCRRARLSLAKQIVFSFVSIFKLRYDCYSFSRRMLIYTTNSFLLGDYFPGREVVWPTTRTLYFFFVHLFARTFFFPSLLVPLP